MINTPQTPAEQGMDARLCHNDVGMSQALREYLEGLGWELPDQDVWTLPIRHGAGTGYHVYRPWLMPLITCDREMLPLFLVNQSAYIEYRGGWAPDVPVKLMIEHLLAYPGP
jgi:hypothetical protein